MCTQNSSVYLLVDDDDDGFTCMNIPELPADDALLKIKLPAMTYNTRRSGARHSDAGSGSHYSASEKSNLGDEDAEGEEEEEEQMVVSTRGRAHKKVSYVESASEEDFGEPPPASGNSSPAEAGPAVIRSASRAAGTARASSFERRDGSIAERSVLTGKAGQLSRR